MTVSPGNTMDASDSDLKPRVMVFSKMEKLVREMQHPETGVPVRSQKTFLSSLPCVFMGYDLIEWLIERLSLEDSAEALHLANLLCQYGYFFPVPDSKALAVKDDGSYYRFQTPYFWPSQNHNPDSTEYASTGNLVVTQYPEDRQTAPRDPSGIWRALKQHCQIIRVMFQSCIGRGRDQRRKTIAITIYLVKRSMRNKQKHGLEDYEQETLNKLKKVLSHKWEFVVMQAEEQLKLSKERKKMDKIVVDSQERAFWRVHWAPPGCVSSLESCPVPLRQNCSRKRKKSQEDFYREINHLKELLSRTRLKVSQAVESLIHHCEVYAEYDPFVVGVQPYNPWITEDTTFWILNETVVENPTEKRVKRWAISLHDMLSDPKGIQEFENYLRKEYSHENIRFWQAVEFLHATSRANVDKIVKEIYEEFLVAGAPCEVNLDSKTVEATQNSMKSPTRFTFDAAQLHVYSLMKKDSYPRFIRSDAYKNLVSNAVQPSQKKRFFNFGVVKKKNSPSGGNSGGANGKMRGSNTNLSGSTSDLHNQREDTWTSGPPNVIGHSLSASNLHDLDGSESPFRLASPKDKGSGYFKGGTLNVSKPKALSTESCNTTPSRNMDLTLEVPNQKRSSLTPPDTRRSSGGSSQEASPVGSQICISTEHLAVNIKTTGAPVTKTYNEVCPWEDMELPTKSNDVCCPWEDQLK